MRSQTALHWAWFVLAVSIPAAASAQNAILNGEFDTDLASWDNLAPNKSWSPLDDGSDPSSGSLLISNTLGVANGQFVTQCVAVQAGTDYLFSWSHDSVGVGATGRADAAIYWYANPTCTGTPMGFEPSSSSVSGPWTDVELALSAPVGAIAALVRLTAWKETGAEGAAWNVYFDHVQLPEPSVAAGALVAIAALARRTGTRARHRTARA